MYLVGGMIVYNEETLIRYSLGSVYNYLDEIVVVDHGSTDKTVQYIKELDVDKKITIINRKWDNNYSNARNTYLEHIKKNIFPKHRTNIYYLRIDADEVYEETWLDGLRPYIEDNLDKESFRINYFTFGGDYGSLDLENPEESRICLFRVYPDIKYINDIHELLIRANANVAMQTHSTLMDERVGAGYIPGLAYLHFAWCDVKRCFKKAQNYTQHYIKQGTETQERLAAMTESEDSWWWKDKKISGRYTGKWPSIIKKLGFLPGQEDHEVVIPKQKVSAFTIVKNAIKFDYPVVESIKSLLPAVDEYIVNIGVTEAGEEDDGTAAMLHKEFDGNEKVKLLYNRWENKSEGTAFLRNQTNWAKDKCSNEWCIYVQADEIYFTKDYDKIHESINKYHPRKDIVGITVNFLHFDGLPTHINPGSYPKEVRIIRRKEMTSKGDAQSFGINRAGGHYAMHLPQALGTCEATVAHYGWLREPEKMLSKLRDFDQYYHNQEEWNQMHKDDEKNHADGKYNYGAKTKVDNYTGNHPLVMRDRIIRYETTNNLEHKSTFEGA